MKTRWNEFYILPEHTRILGIVLMGFVFLNRRVKTLDAEELQILLNHERIHIRQQLELLVLPFFLLYVGEWLVLRWKYKDGDQAYRNISFEKEAYAHANNLTYLKQRKAYYWIQYWKRKNKNG